MNNVQKKLDFIEERLENISVKEGVKPVFLSLLKKMWLDFLHVQDAGVLKGDAKGWLGALYYILQKYFLEKNISQKDCAKLFNISKSTLGRRYRDIRQDINVEDYKTDLSVIKEDIRSEKQDKKEKEMSKGRQKNKAKEDQNRNLFRARNKALKNMRKVQLKTLNEEQLISLFKEMKRVVSILHPDKDYIEIKRFLQFVEINLLMSGYEPGNMSIEKKFGELFFKLGMVPRKGRRSEKFVYLSDRYGNLEPFVLIKLRG